MCDCVPSSPLAFSTIKARKLGLNARNSRQYCSSFHTSITSNGRLKFVSKSTRANKNPGPLSSEEYEIYGELGFKEKGEDRFELESRIDKDSSVQNDKATDLPGLEDKERSGEMEERSKEEDLVRVEESRQVNGRLRGLGRGRQVIRRSNLLAKQVISIQSALTLGFVSQIWVDTTSVMFPSLDINFSQFFLFNFFIELNHSKL